MAARGAASRPGPLWYARSGMKGERSRRPLRALAGVLLLLACAGDLVAVEGGFRHRRHGYAFREPGVPWRRIDLNEAVIAYRRPGPATMSLQTRSGGPLAEPSVLARHLRIGQPAYTLRQAGPVAIGARQAWTQTLDAGSAGAVVRVKTVTLVVESCTLDWILVAGDAFEDAEPDFDAWVASTQLPGDLEGRS